MNNKTNSHYLDESLKLLNPDLLTDEPQIHDRGVSIDRESRVLGVNAESRTIEALVSTATIDRYGEIVEPKAFAKHLETFRKNPVLLASHQYAGFDAGQATVIGHWSNMRITDDGLVGTAHFANTQLADEYWQLYRDGHMKAFSVGFRVHAWEMSEVETEDGKRKVRVFTDVELLEVSAVAVPANPDAVLIARAFPRSDATGKGPDGEAIREQLKQFIDEAVREAVSEKLKAEIGTDLYELIYIVIEASKSSESHGYNDHDDPLGNEQAPGGSSELQELLGPTMDRLKT